jgi:hypothetical protein
MSGEWVKAAIEECRLEEEEEEGGLEGEGL